MGALFSSQQCTNHLEVKPRALPFELCMPSDETIISYIGTAITKLNSSIDELAVYISTDNDTPYLWSKLSSEFPNIDFVTPKATYSNSTISVSHSEREPMIDLYLMAKSNYFIGNCISSFTAFVSRMRKARKDKEKTVFFGDHLLKPYHLLDEL